MFTKLLDDYYLHNKPLGHITKSTIFAKLPLDLYKGVLAPRDETELLCKYVIDILKKDRKLIYGADLCCGSGNIAVAVKKNCAFIDMTAIDINETAVMNTKHNAKKNKVVINVIKGDFYQTLIKKHLRFDLLISNPPYVSNDELDKSMLKYEDKKCFVNSKGDLFFYETLINNHKKIVNDEKHFLLAFEIGYNQKKRIQKLLSKQKLLKFAQFYKDLNNHDRILIIYKN
jgi:HemK-like putative methylase